MHSQLSAVSSPRSRQTFQHLLLPRCLLVLVPHPSSHMLVSSGFDYYVYLNKTDRP
jgi:hypothetical protein